MKGDLAVEFSSNAGAATPTTPALSADFGVASGMGFPTTDADPPKLDEEFQLGQKAHVLEQGGSTNDDRVRRYAELTGTGVQQQGERKEKDERSFRTQLAVRSQAELRERLDTMRADLGRKIDQRISIVEQMLAAAQKALAQAQSEQERLVRIQEQIIEEGYWKLSTEDQEFLERTAGKEVVEAYKKHDPKLEKARDAKNADPQSKEKSEAFEREAEQSRAIVKPAIENTKAEAKKAEADVEKHQAELDRIGELKRELDKPEVREFEVGPDGKFTDKLLQRAADKAGINPATFDSSKTEAVDKLYDGFDKVGDELTAEIEAASGRQKTVENVPNTKLGG